MEKLPEAKEKLLISVRNDIQANLIENLLKEKNIYCAKRRKAVGALAAIYTGMSNFGVDVYVSENDFAKASEILEMYQNPISDEELEAQALSFNAPDSEDGD